MNIMLPWNMSFYLALNCFHPLYRALAEYSGDHRFIIPRHDISVTEFNRLVAGGLYNKYIDDQLWWLEGANQDIVNRFHSFFSLRELNYVSQLPGDIELLHTAPVTCGHRPFFLHIESFLPFFTPFSIGKEDEFGDILDYVRPFYARLLKKCCLGIVSHRSDTLQQISYYFSDPEIDEKLKQIDIGIPTKKYKSIEKNYKLFLFTASAHQNSNNFSHRGGYISLHIALTLLNRNDLPECRFVFRAQRPCVESLIEEEVNLEELKKAEKLGHIVWIETPVSEEMISKLYSRSDFLLLPSCVLHSDAVLRSMMHGAVPVVTDAPGYDYYVDSEISVILTGVKEKLYDFYQYQKCKPCKKFNELRNTLIKQGIDKILVVLKDERLYRSISDKLVVKANTKFSKQNMLSAFMEYIEDLASEVVKAEKKKSKIYLGEDYIEDLEGSWFELIPQPVKVYHTGKGITRRALKKHIYLNNSMLKDAAALGTYGPLNLWWHKFSCGKKSDFLFSNDPGELSNVLYRMEVLKDITIKVKKPVKHIVAGKLRQYPVLFEISKKSYRFLRKSRVLR